MSAHEEIVQYGLQPEAFIVMASVFLALSTVVVGLRIYVRGFMTRAWGLDDTLLVLAWVTFAADSSSLIRAGVIELKSGITGTILELISKVIAVETLYIATQLLLKASLALFVIRILLVKWQIWVVRISLTIYLTVGIIFFFIALFVCGDPTPIDFITHQCLDWPHIIGPLNYFFSILNAIMDWTLTIMPVVVVLKLQIPQREKIAACILILFGMFGSIVSVVRIPYVPDLQFAHLGLSFFKSVIPVGLCSIAESGIGIIALGLAALRPLWVRVVGGTHSRATDRANYGHSKPPTRLNTAIRQDVEIIQKRMTIGGSVLVAEMV